MSGMSNGVDGTTIAEKAVKFVMSIANMFTPARGSEVPGIDPMISVGNSVVRSQRCSGQCARIIPRKSWWQSMGPSSSRE